MASDVRPGRPRLACTTLALLVAIVLTFAQVAAAQEAADPSSAGGLSESLYLPEGSTSSTGATIASDQRDYAPGATVTLTGSGWQPGESVRIVVNDDGLQEQAWQRDVTVVAAADGTIGDFFELPWWFVERYTVTATGEYSGVTSTSFTDAALPNRGCALPSLPGGPIVVDTTTDEFSAPGGPDPAAGPCSLREAVQAANADSTADTIQLAAGTYTLTISGAGGDNNQTGDLDVLQPLTINGAGARTTIVQAGTTNANGIDRVLHVTSSGSLTLSGASVRHGLIANADGGGILSSRPLTLTDVAVVDNTLAAASGDTRRGGGIANDGGSLTINRATISGNQVTGTGQGGGIHTTSGGTLTNATVTNNAAGGEGGGVRTTGGTTTLTNVTVSHNTAPTGAGIRRDSGTINLRNTIVSTNGTSNCSGTVGNSSNNLDSAATCNFGALNGSKSNANAALGNLQNNGGPTDTRALGPGSAAIDAGTASGAPGIDQRSVGRPQGAGHDIGAVELSSVTLTRVNGATVTFPHFTNGDVSSVGGSCVDALGNVSVTLNASPASPATATCSGGSWTLTLATALSAEGNYTFAASQVGATPSGNKAVTIDKTAPVVTLEEVNGAARAFPYSTNQNVTSVGGSCASGDGPVSVTLDGSAADPATASCSGGTWTLTLAAALSADGSYTFAASQTDAAGNAGGSGDKVVTIDKTAPVVTLEEVNGATRTFPYLTNQNVTSVGGSCTAGDGPVSITLDGSATAPSTAACSGGTWTLTLTTPLSADASYTFAASQTDAAGNAGGSGDKVVTIDKTAPTVTLEKVNSATRTFPYLTNQNVTSVGGSCTAGDGPVSVTLDGASTAPATASCSGGSWELTLTTALSADGSYTFAASQTDAAGNAGGSGDKVVTIDKTPPEISDLGPTATPNGDNGWYTSAVTNRFKATDGGSGLDADCLAAFPDDAGDRVQSKTTSGEGAEVTVESDGCSDVAGNAAPPKTSAKFKIDLTDPSVAIGSPPDGSSTSSPSIAVSGAASDTPSGLASVTVNGSAVTVNPDGSWSTTVDLACGSEPTTITAIAKDNSGRTNIDAIDVTRNCAQGPADLHARFLAPLDESVKSTTRIANKAKSGRVVPVQIELYSGQTQLTAAEIAEGDVTLQATKMQTCDAGAAETLETYAAAGSANTGSTFRWSGTKMIFNLDTANKAYAFAVNGCYRLNVLYKETLISWAPSPTAPATNVSTAADWWAYLQIMR